VASNFGLKISLPGLALSGLQTFVAVTDGDITTGDTLQAISTALGAAGLGCALFGAFPVAGVLGVASGVVGFISLFFNDLDLPQELRLQLEDGRTITIHFIT